MLAIAQVGESILNRQAQKVIEFSPALMQLANDMLDTMLQAKGVGIAAPQVNQSLSLFIMASRPNERYPDAPFIEPSIVVNPKIIVCSDEKISGEEGCLSIAEQRFTILRHEWVEVSFQDLNGLEHHQTLTGFIARIFQHEYDHLQGITLIERSAMQASNSLNEAVR
ncbi:peptide deformylase [Shewanella psychropiezotolerans]|uniref:Peptide deformylase n=1 Tax=Shewanella psychropiezotolerans TaxID=2593655 RepID=A0ABX5WV44_9GAMM|nr:MULTISPECIES: peptide deformylase [Shewanella]MPY23152.1 peptide deformylase [Shewanella sp. YLB-07]QDO82788.1 peptide deformylase [Shewanella psychropiezotolerans]